MSQVSPLPGGEVALFEAPDGLIRLDVRLERDTVWLTQAQMAELFGRERSVITKHIGNVFKEGELDRKSVCANFAHTAQDGKIYQVQFYNLDVILAVGYRTNSAEAVEFRKWATKTLRAHIIDGYTINRSRIADNYDKFLKAVEQAKMLLYLSGFLERLNGLIPRA